MKNILYASLIAFSLFFAQSSKAQVSVNINIGSQPLWGPAGYDYVRYYYLPEVNVYYSVVNKNYTYRKGNKWITRPRLPREYRHVDMYRTHKVVINDNRPWHNHNQYYNRYSRNKHHRSQVVIRDARNKGNGHNYNGKHKEKRKHGRDHHRDNRRGDR